MSNYVYENGAVTPIQDIIDHAEEAKENEGSSLTLLKIINTLTVGDA